LCNLMLQTNFYTQTPNVIAHDPLSLNVRYSWQGFVLCICLFIILFINFLL